MGNFSNPYLALYGPMAVALVAEAETGGATVISMRDIVMQHQGIDIQGVAGFWCRKKSGNRYMFRTENLGYPAQDGDGADVTTRCRAVAAAYLKQASPDDMYWVELFEKSQELNKIVQEIIDMQKERT